MDATVPIESRRINIVDADGRIRLALFNADEMPDVIQGGVAYPGKRQGSKRAGLIFYDAHGNECGGLIFGSTETVEGQIEQGLSLTFDAFQQDQVIQVFSEDVAGRRRYGLRMVDRPTRSLREELERWSEVAALPDGPTKAAAMDDLRAGHAQRVFVGRDRDGTAQVSLHDGAGQARLRLAVTHDGETRLEFLNAAGDVVYALPPSSAPAETPT